MCPRNGTAVLRGFTTRTLNVRTICTLIFNTVITFRDRMLNIRTIYALLFNTKIHYIWGQSGIVFCCRCCLHIKPFFLYTQRHEQHTQCPSRFFVLDTNSVVTVRQRNTKLVLQPLIGCLRFTKFCCVGKQICI